MAGKNTGSFGSDQGSRSGGSGAKEDLPQNIIPVADTKTINAKGKKASRTPKVWENHPKMIGPRAKPKSTEEANKLKAFPFCLVPTPSTLRADRWGYRTPVPNPQTTPEIMSIGLLLEKYVKTAPAHKKYMAGSNNLELPQNLSHRPPPKRKNTAVNPKLV